MRANYKIRENWCPSDANCGFWERLVGCDVSDCTQPSPTCAIQAIQQGKLANSTRFNALLQHLEGGVNSCVNANGCTGDQIMGSFTPSLFPGDGRSIGFHVEQMTNTHPQCTGSGQVIVDRATYGGPGTLTNDSVQAGHLPLSLADVCYLLHDLMFCFATPDNGNNLRIHADLVLLHNLNHVRNNLGEIDFNISTAQTAFCISEPNGMAGGTWDTGFGSQFIPGIVGAASDPDLNVFSANGGIQQPSLLDNALKVVRAMKVAVQNGVGVISSFGFFEDMEVGGSITTWGSGTRSNAYYQRYGSNSSSYFAYQYFNNYRKQEFINRLFTFANTFSNTTRGRWGTLITNCD